MLKKTREMVTDFELLGLPPAGSSLDDLHVEVRVRIRVRVLCRRERDDQDKDQDQDFTCMMT